MNTSLEALTKLYEFTYLLYMDQNQRNPEDLNREMVNFLNKILTQIKKMEKQMECQND